MNLLGIAKVLKDIRVGELEADIQYTLATYINKAFTVEFDDVTQLTGTDIINSLSKGHAVEGDVASRQVFKNNSQLIYFLENVERIRNDRIYNTNLNDAVMGTSIGYLAVLLLVITAMCIGVYGITTKSRGDVPESHVVQILHVLTESIVPNHEGDQSNDATIEEPAPDTGTQPPPTPEEPIPVPASEVLDNDG